MKWNADLAVKSAAGVRRAALWAMFLPALVWAVLPLSGAWAGPEALQAGKATIERLGPVFIDGAGPMVDARAGDWRLANEHISLTFVSVDDTPTTISQPIGGWLRRIHPEMRVPGALIDIAVDGDIIDFLGNFTQGVGLGLNDPALIYDTAEPIQKGREVGLRLEGSPFEANPVRLETTYWLAEGSYQVRLETRFIDAPADRPMPDIVDVGNWGRASAFLPGRGFATFEGEKALRTPFLIAHGADMAMGVVPRASSVQGNFSGRPSKSRLMAFPTPMASPPDGQQDPSALPLPVENFPQTGMDQLLVRDLWFGHGRVDSVSNLIYTQAGHEYGTFTGRLLDRFSGEPIANARIEVMQLENVTRRPRAFRLTLAGVDGQGRFLINLPPGSYYLKPVTNSTHRGIGNFVPLKAGETIDKDLVGIGDPGLKIQVLDAETAQPIAARLHFEPIAPTEAVSFGAPSSARAYLQYATLGLKGDQVPLPIGNWEVSASCGPRYEVAQLSVEVKNQSSAECVIYLKKVNPTPGWESVAPGLRTNATPGVAVSADDMVLMAAAEGLDWITSGDFEKITDFQPIIERMGLASHMHAMRGFRTLMPMRPEWGQFLIFPVAADAPDPSTARAAWASLTSPGDFFKALRAAYPGAMIQVDLPDTPGAKPGELGPQGYFSMPGKNAYEISSAPNPEISLDFDAINILPDRQAWDLASATNLYYNHAMFARSYLASTSATGRIVLGSEPGYPRILALTGHKPGAPADQKTLTDTLRIHRTQLTTGPVIDFKADDALPGGLTALNNATPVDLRVTAPAWISVNMISVDKEDVAQLKQTFDSNTNNVQRFPDPAQGNGDHLFTLGSFRLVNDKDTLLGVTVAGRGSLDPYIPRDPESPMIPSFAMTSPIAIDANGNGVFDALKDYTQKGR